MKINVTRIRLTPGTNTLCGIASVLVEDSLAIHDIKILKKEEKYFIAMPSQKDNHGVFRNVVHPINKELRQAFEEKVLVAFLIEKNN